jgi:glutathionylspermidine synthase
MRRVPISPRTDWQAKVEATGLIFHTEEGNPYWNESAYYEFTAAEIEDIEVATNQCHRMCLAAIEWVIENRAYESFRIPDWVIPAIEKAWELEPPTLYGRFDFVFDGSGSPKMLEYNADTPTSLLEAAVTQWKWLEDFCPEADQFNSIWEGLIEQWQWLVDNRKLNGRVIHFGHCDLWEDQMTVAVLQDTAHQVGLETVALQMSEIGWHQQNGYFVDANHMKMHSVFKLYPWEWMVQEEFGRFAVENLSDTQWIEPIWKMLLSNKALLPILWRLNPESPYMLESYNDSPNGMESYVCKPILGREGQGVEIVRPALETVRSNDSVPAVGPSDAVVFQQYQPIPDFDGNYPVVGSWVIGEDARGMGIRETDGPITNNLARFVPHLFR